MFLKRHDDPRLEEAIACVTQTIIDRKHDTEQIEQLSLVLERLTKMRASRISPDTIATVSANLAGIIMILTHERAHVIASKALGFVFRR